MPKENFYRRLKELLENTKSGKANKNWTSPSDLDARMSKKGGKESQLNYKDIGGYIPSFGPYKPTREGFTYYPEGDYFMCSQGKKLPFKKILSRKDNFRKVYWSSKAECKDCPCKTNCVGVAAFKTLEDTTDRQYYDRMHERATSAKGKRMKTLRSAKVEPVKGKFFEKKRVVLM